jgi:pimeloyl-ACP methyl ester carboxylesterase
MYLGGRAKPTCLRGGCALRRRIQVPVAPGLCLVQGASIIHREETQQPFEILRISTPSRVACGHTWLVTQSELAPYLRTGSGEALVLIHGVTVTWQWWEHLLPDLSKDFDVLAPTLPGHPGGAPLPRPATIAALADGVETVMDKEGVREAHIVGHSLGGWTAYELARRGRALSVTAISPAGGWSNEATARRVLRMFLFNYWPARLSGRAGLAAMRVPIVRWMGFRNFVAHPGRLTREQVERAATWLATFDHQLLRDFTREQLQPYPDLGIPSTLAWGDGDRLFPAETYGAVWREAAPHAEWRMISSAGHNADVDNPDAVLELIREATRRR